MFARKSDTFQIEVVNVIPFAFGCLRFVKGLERDKEVVLAGLMLVYSNGQVEGFVNRLKLIKRMGYGRASFPLLRQRILCAF